MSRVLATFRITQIAAVSVWIAAFLDPDSYGLAGTVTGSVVLLVGATEVAYRTVSHW